MTAPTLVTGGSGFLGRLLVRRLADEGRPVRVLERRPSDAWDGLAVERVPGDVTDAGALAAACAGVASVLHLAGVVSHRRADTERLLRVNVGGVERTLEAARAAGVGRVVHVSSIAAVGWADDGPVDEESPYPAAARRLPYALSKRLGDEAALRAAAEGQDVVVVCPGFVIGAGDVNRVSTFGVEQYLRGRLRFTTDGGLTYVDARDVVDGILLAEARGVPGRRYVLGSRDGLLDHRAFFRLVGQVAGAPRRTVHVPSAILVPGARAAAAVGVPLPVHPDELAASVHRWLVPSDRAVAELGYDPRPVVEAVEATVRWYADGARG